MGARACCMSPAPLLRVCSSVSKARAKRGCIKLHQGAFCASDIFFQSVRGRHGRLCDES
ncbi:hypothetical protein BC826DRAFT_389692 [Russula brevipes]|nr:hypothetical protein BC826DRAFT_389692 [Russula brevipes]